MIIVYNGWIKYEINSYSVNHKTKLINLEVKTMFLKLKNVYKKEFVQSITSIEYWCTMLFTSNSLNRVLIFQSALISLEFNETQKVLLESEINDYSYSKAILNSKITDLVEVKSLLSSQQQFSYCFTLIHISLMFISTPPKNVRKRWCFQGVQKRNNGLKG